jgi:IS30 family transposase
VFFAPPATPWLRGTNENTNGLLRQYFPKGTNLRLHTAEELAAVEARLNDRPRKIHRWRTPRQVFTTTPTRVRRTCRSAEPIARGAQVAFLQV